jgi:hypothetical protein
MTPTPGSTAKARTVVPPCSCSSAHTDRGLTDPNCAWCDHGEAVAELLDAERAEALSEKRFTVCCKCGYPASDPHSLRAVCFCGCHEDPRALAAKPRKEKA